MLRAIGSLCVVVAIAACAAASGAVRRSQLAVRHSGIAGLVASGPICPVERIPPDPACAPRPLSATLRITRQGGRRVASVRSGADGRFRVRLRAGVYVVQGMPVSSNGFPRPPWPSTVRVVAHRFTYIKVIYDTGIR